MSAKFVLGARDGRDVHVDLGRLVESRMLVQANSGGGKSWALRRILEQTHGSVQHLVLDVEGEFHTLRERFDYVLAARNGGDCLADARTASLLARRLLELGVSAICDIYELPRHEQRLFVRRFLEALIGAPRALWHPTLVVVDEAHIFCPEKGQAESASAVIDLMTLGRKRGFCGVLATQRLSKLHKDAAAEANVKLIGRTGLDVDMKRAGEELGFTSSEQRLSLRNLPPGHFFTFGPGVSNEVLQVHVGDVVTTHPRPGARATPIPPARDKVKKVLAQLADLPKKAAEEARTVAELQAANAKLRRELAAKPAPAAVKVERVEVPVIKPAELTRIETLVARMEVAGEKHRERADECVDAVRQLREFVSVKFALAPPVVKAPPAQRAHAPAAAPARATRSTGAAPGGAGTRRVLTAVVQHGEQGCSREQITVLTGYKRSTRDKYVYLLVQAGHVTDNGGAIVATDAGIRELGDVEPLPVGGALREHWLSELPEGERRVLEVAIAAYPQPVSRDAITEATSYKRSTRDKYVYLLALRRLVEPIGRGEMRASATLFD